MKLSDMLQDCFITVSHLQLMCVRKLMVAVNPADGPKELVNNVSTSTII